MSPDPILISPERQNPQTWNKYFYVFNNPLRLVDPDGRWPTAEHTRQLNVVFGTNGYNLGDHTVAMMVSTSHLQDCWHCGGQSAAGAQQHAMSNGLKALVSEAWAKSDAQADYSRFVSDHIESAAGAQAFYEGQGGKGYSDFAIAQFTEAAHAVEDNDSPEHRGFSHGLVA